MFKELKDSIPGFQPPPKNGGLLTPWADQGILLLNTCLTVRAHEANSHSNQGWESFTQKVIDLVAKVRTRGVVFLAWGSPAQKRCAKISGAKHVVLKAVHPSPLSAARGWFGCGHFKQTNEWLEERYGKDGVINWSLDVQKPIKAPGKPGESVKVADSQAADTKVSDSLKTPTKADNKAPAAKKDEFDEEEDEDAIEALEELAKSEAAQTPSQKTPVKKQEAEEDLTEDKENDSTKAS